MEDELPVANRLDGIPLPSEISQLIGHDQAVKQLMTASTTGRMHHAWMVTGAKGIGKASLAFAVSKFLLSSREELGSDALDWDPRVHGQVVQGAHPGLLHLARPWDDKSKKFKSQLSVDEIRKTQKFFGMSAGSDSWRITIVDAADEMNASAANALLKILEEPPRKSLFFVLAHSTGTLLPTLRSRCQMLPLDPLSTDNVETILNQFELDSEPAQIASAATLANGSVRKALQLLEGKISKDFDTFLKLMETGASGSARDWTQVTPIADRLAARDNDQSFKLYVELVTNWLEDSLRIETNATSLSMLAAVAQVWEKTRESMTVAEAYNLDKKQVILTLFGRLFLLNASRR